MSAAALLRRVIGSINVGAGVLRRPSLALMAVAVAAGGASVAAAQAAPAQAAPAQAPTGRIAGQIIARETARPIPSVQVQIVGTTMGAIADLDGRYRTPPLPAGKYTLRFTRIGFRPQVRDSIAVTAGQTLTIDIAMDAVSVVLNSVVVQADQLKSASSDEALLALQHASARVSDGISAQAISRAPGSDAADAVTRITGVTVTPNKFVVVRGLAERYSNTLLNGVELASPEPLKKVAPLDMFPSSLLESIVANKTATPDKPGDFAGGSVEITTKEFPEHPVREGSLSFGYNSLTTGKLVSTMPQRGVDWFGFDDGGRRQMPSTAGGPELFAESLRDVWTPLPRRVLPDLGASLNLGGQVGSDHVPLGYAISGTYSHKNQYTPNQLGQLVLTKNQVEQGHLMSEAATTTDLGAIANFSTRLGSSNKIGWKNLYTRNAEEAVDQGTSYKLYIGPTERISYQTRYVTRQLLQTQLTGDHVIGPLFDSRFEWKATLSSASRNEPENRSVQYYNIGGVPQLSGSTTTPFWFRFLHDDLKAAQVDWSLPFSLHHPEDAQFKIGALQRDRKREFDADVYLLELNHSIDPTTSIDQISLPPEQALAPENIGPIVQLTRSQADALPYTSDDRLRAVYGMLDLPLLSWLRLVGGLRVEDWKFNLLTGSNELYDRVPVGQHDTDYLWSGNLTVSLTDRQNLRFAAYRTLARPDPREVAPDFYLAVTGACGSRGDTSVKRTRILNGDVRWEWFPNAGELVSVSGFYKKFDRPIIEVVEAANNDCFYAYGNADAAQNLGGEFEIRKALAFLPGILRHLSAGMNLTLVHSRTDYRPIADTVLHLPLVGQSNYIVNGSLAYDDEQWQATVLVNAFGDRVLEYGNISEGNGVISVVPSDYEKGRMTVDAKIQRRIRQSLTVSLSGRNLTNVPNLSYQKSDLLGRIRTSYAATGTTISLGVGYAFR